MSSYSGAFSSGGGDCSTRCRFREEEEEEEEEEEAVGAARVVLVVVGLRIFADPLSKIQDSDEPRSCASSFSTVSKNSVHSLEC